MDDTISRAAALKTAEWAYRACEDNLSYYHDLLVAALMDLTPAQPGWISCKKRLPNRDEYIKNNGLFIVSDGNRSYSEWYDFYDKRRFGEPTMSGFRVDYAVTHWMLFPEPWKGKQNE